MLIEAATAKIQCDNNLEDKTTTVENVRVDEFRLICLHRLRHRIQIEHFACQLHMYDDNRLLSVLIYFSRRIVLECIQQLDRIRSGPCIHESRLPMVNVVSCLRIDLSY
jgi:hypothetical protein